jgi:hypothetical protein
MERRTELIGQNIPVEKFKTLNSCALESIFSRLLT